MANIKGLESVVSQLREQQTSFDVAGHQQHGGVDHDYEHQRLPSRRGAVRR
jgi:hypothetical protein